MIALGKSQIYTTKENLIMDKNYLFLFNALTDLIAELESIRQRAIWVQQMAEERYISSGTDAPSS